MEQVGAFDAKTRLSELLSRASKGESFLITKHGKPMARLVPENEGREEAVVAAAECLRNFRGELKETSLEELRSARHLGHRY